MVYTGDIPTDIVMAASKALGKGSWRPDRVRAVAEAIFAERKRASAVTEELLDALRPFAPFPGTGLADLMWGSMDDHATGTASVKLRDFRRAIAAIERAEGK